MPACKLQGTLLGRYFSLEGRLTLIGQPGDGDERGGFPAPYLKRDDRALVQAGEQLVELVDRFELGVLSFVVSPLTLHHRVLRLCEQNRMRQRPGSYCHAP